MNVPTLTSPRSLREEKALTPDAEGPSLPKPETRDPRPEESSP